MRCSACGRDNPEGNRFCAGCGQALAPTPSPPVAPAAPRPTDRPPGAAASPLSRWIEYAKSGEWMQNRLLTIVLAALLVYSLFLGNPWMIVVSLGIAWAGRGHDQ